MMPASACCPGRSPCGRMAFGPRSRTSFSISPRKPRVNAGEPERFPIHARLLPHAVWPDTYKVPIPSGFIGSITTPSNPP